jgi:hypothetical protein
MRVLMFGPASIHKVMLWVQDNAELPMGVRVAVQFRPCQQGQRCPESGDVGSVRVI